MKQIFTISLLVVLLFTGLQSNSQGDISLFAEEGTEWSVGIFSQYPHSPYRMAFIKLEGDTVINEITYNILWYNDYHFSESDLGEISAFVRVDEDSVLYIRSLANVEKILFDYRLLIGEWASLNACFFSWMNPEDINYYEVTANVCDLASIAYFGQMRKTWELCEEEYPGAVWIQGVGPISGILWSNIGLTSWVGSYTQLLCAHFNGEQIYQNPEHDYCELFHADYYDRVELLANENTIWSVGTFYSPYNPHRIDYLWLNGNTQLAYYDYNFYHIVRISETYPPTIENSEIAFYVQVLEDSVLYIKNLLGEKHPVFDFKLTEGEEANLYIYDYLADLFTPVTVVVESVDSIETMSGMRKVWTISSDFSTEWIEGLGNSEGLIYSNWELLGLVGQTNLMICAFNVEEQLYLNPLFSDCFISYVDEPDFSNTDISITPNPTTDIIHIKSKSQGFTTQICDVVGNVLLQKVCLVTEEQIDLSKYPNGIYIVKILTKGKMSSLKISKI